MSQVRAAMRFYTPSFWIPRAHFDLYNIKGKIEPNPMTNESGEVASRSCLLSFLSALKFGHVGSPGTYASVAGYYRDEPVEIPGVRQSVFPQLEIEVIDRNPEKALRLTLDLLAKILGCLSGAYYKVRIQGEVSKAILARPEVQYAGVDRQWKLYKTKRDIGFEVYVDGSEDALAGGGDFTELAWKFGLDRRFSAVGFGIGLLRIK